MERDSPPGRLAGPARRLIEALDALERRIQALDGAPVPGAGAALGAAVQSFDAAAREALDACR